MRQVLLALLLVWLGAVGGGCVSVDVSGMFGGELRERRVEPAEHFTFNKILLIDLHGVISGAAPDRLKAILNKAELDPFISAVVLRIDSPGGEVTASDVMYQELVRYRQRRRVPVIASIGGMGCSGGYYIACAADRIYAHPTAVVGSIGVIARFPRVSRLADKIGLDMVTLKSGPLKDMGDPFRELDPEARRILQETLDAMYGRFVNVVAAGRPALAQPAAVRPLADGRIFTADQALEAKLVDGVGYLPDAIAAARQAAGVRAAHVITYTLRDNADTNIYTAAAPGPAGLHLVNVDLGAWSGVQATGFLYLWSPVGAP
jgi:protease-4